MLIDHSPKLTSAKISTGIPNKRCVRGIPIQRNTSPAKYFAKCVSAIMIMILLEYNAGEEGLPILKLTS
jgi:hypothetical protein